MIFLNCIFGYLCILIVAKWVIPGCIVDLYHVMIYMFLSPGKSSPEYEIFHGQGGLQVQPWAPGCSGHRQAGCSGHLQASCSGNQQAGRSGNQQAGCSGQGEAWPGSTSDGWL